MSKCSQGTCDYKLVSTAIHRRNQERKKLPFRHVFQKYFELGIVDLTVRKYKCKRCDDFYFGVELHDTEMSKFVREGVVVDVSFMSWLDINKLRMAFSLDSESRSSEIGIIVKITDIATNDNLVFSTKYFGETELIGKSFVPKTTTREELIQQVEDAAKELVEMFEYAKHQPKFSGFYLPLTKSRIYNLDMELKTNECLRDFSFDNLALALKNQARIQGMPLRVALADLPIDEDFDDADEFEDLDDDLELFSDDLDGEDEFEDLDDQ